MSSPGAHVSDAPVRSKFDSTVHKRMTVKSDHWPTLPPIQPACGAQGRSRSSGMPAGQHNSLRHWEMCSHAQVGLSQNTLHCASPFSTDQQSCHEHKCLAKVLGMAFSVCLVRHAHTQDVHTYLHKQTYYSSCRNSQPRFLALPSLQRTVTA